MKIESQVTDNQSNRLSIFFVATSERAFQTGKIDKKGG